MCVLIHFRTINCLSSPVFFTDIPRRCFFRGSFLLMMFHVYLYYAVLPFPCSLMVTCLERAVLGALLCIMFFVSDVEQDLSMPDLCLPPYI